MLIFSPAAFAIFAMVPADRVDEVPLERLLANLERNAQGLEPGPKFRAIGRLHLLAYLRRVAALPVYRDRGDTIAEGKIDDCATLDAQVSGKGTRENFPEAKPGERCEARTYSLGPKREIPAEAFGVRRGLDRHLAAAITAYERARALEPSNLRGRVALAFAYDRAARRVSARRELRFVMYQGLKQIPAPVGPGEMSADWETHTVVSEAVEHFAMIAKARTDRRLIARVKKRLTDSPPAMYVTPILVPLKRDASFEQMVDRTSKVSFDFSGQGLRLKAGWLTADAAWLVWDPKDKRTVTSGFQLFGSATWVASWNNGYQALGALDDDGDGAIAGAELAGLALWHDRDGDGVCDAGEVEPVAAHGIVSLRYGHERVGDDLWVSGAGVTFADGEVRPTYDWLLREAVIQAGD
ncbi:MAG: hypothetical protein HOP13_11050 [Alphaproteobacteria bacterium]|nr:hypothetical protein [Alphaproteobacteria bacterium]